MNFQIKKKIDLFSKDKLKVNKKTKKNENEKRNNCPINPQTPHHSIPQTKKPEPNKKTKKRNRKKLKKKKP